MTSTKTGSRLSILCLLLVVCVAFTGCAIKQRILNDHEAGAVDLAAVEQMGAKICAPMEFASAEAHLDFALDEWAERDYSAAQKHLDQAEADLAEARSLSANCIELTPPDTDGDGITDDRDGCPQTAEDFDQFEDQDGCPEADNDGDGIPDTVDKCPAIPETVNGVDDTDGCPDQAYRRIEVTQEQIVLKERIHYETGSSTIAVDSYPILDEVVEALNSNLAIRIRVEGHTDSVGSRASNLTLSEKRAQSVVDYLTGHGIAASRMFAEGYGPDRPVAPNNTDRGRAKNRRVEIHIVD